MYLFEPSACAHLDALPPVGIPRDMPFLLDDEGIPIEVVNRWLRSLPTTGVPAPKSWLAYARDLAAWVRFLRGRSLGVLDEPAALVDAVAAYHANRRSEDLARRLSAPSWNRAVASISRFYEWAQGEGLIAAVPFSYRLCAIRTDGSSPRLMRRNLAKERQPRRHMGVRWLEQDYLEFFLDVGLAGMAPDGGEDPDFGGREAGRNVAAGRLAASSGLRAQELSHLLVWEIPLPPRDPGVPVVALAVPAPIAKGGKARTTWVSPTALAAVHAYLRLERPLAVGGSAWRPKGAPLWVSAPDAVGGRVNGRRVRWRDLTLDERRRLVAPGGGSALWAVRSDGGGLADWEYVFGAASQRCRHFEARFPPVSPHVLRHSFAVHTLRWLVRTQLCTVAKALRVAGAEPAWALALRAQDPLLVLRDLLGHSSVATTEIYLRLIDTTRLFTEAELDAAGGPG